MPARKELYKTGERTLKDCGAEDYAFDAMQLLLEACGISRSEYLLTSEQNVSEEELEKYLAFIGRRKAGEPLQYILGKWDFFGHEYYVGEGVLIPRPETEELAAYCAGFLSGVKGRPAVFDLCAGSGCIGLSLAGACKNAEVYLFEKYEVPVSYIKKNITPDIEGRVKIVRQDIFLPPEQNLPRPVLIVSNPPYIPSAEICGLQKEVLREPVAALDGGEDGLDFYRCIRRSWTDMLLPGGIIALECGEGQASGISALFAGVGDISVKKDFYKTDRFVIISKKQKEA